MRAPITIQRNRGRRMMLVEPSLQKFLDGIVGTDWLHLQEQSGSVALATNSALALGRELLKASGTSGTATAANWDSFRGAVLTNPSVGELRIARDGAQNDPQARQDALTNGKDFTTGPAMQARSDGNAVPRLIDHGNVVLWTGTNSTDWQTVDTDWTQSGGTLIRLEAQTSTGSEFVEFRLISVKQTDIAASSAFASPGDNPMDLTNTGMAVGQPGAGNVPYIFLGDGATTGLVYDTIAEWNSKFNPDKLTMAVVVRVDDWLAGTGVIWRLAVDANTEIVLERRASELAWRYNVEGNFDEVTFDTATLPGGSPSEPFTMVMTVDTDGGGEIIGYMKGVARGTSTITGEWTGNFDPAECGVFAADNAQLNSLDGGGAHVGLGYRVWSPAEVVGFNTRSGL